MTPAERRAYNKGYWKGRLFGYRLAREHARRARRPSVMTVMYRVANEIHPERRRRA